MAENPVSKTVSVGSDLSDIEKLIRHHLLHNDRITYNAADLFTLFESARSALLDDPSLIKLSEATYVFGDLYGHFKSLPRLMSTCGFPPKANWVFLGNYGSRSDLGLETLVLLLALKVQFPKRIYLLRGNHECQNLAGLYGLGDDIKLRRFPDRLWEELCELFEVFPLACTIGDKIFCCHGGLSPVLLEEKGGLDKITQIRRPAEVPESGLIFDLLWACPTHQPGWAKDSDGLSTTFGPDIVEQFCKKTGIELIVRGFQLVSDGYLFYPNRYVLTVFSSPNFDGAFENQAAVIYFDKTLKATIKRYKMLKAAKMTTEGMVTTGDPTKDGGTTTGGDETSGRWNISMRPN